jgi:hypothetical protein
MLWGPALASWLCKCQKGESSTRCPSTVLNPGETNREQKGDEPYCPDHQNTNIGEEEKERDLEKMQELLGCSPLSSEPALLGWPYTKKGTVAQVLCRRRGERTPITSRPHLPHCHEWTRAAPLLQRERIKKRLREEKEGI